MLDHPSARMRRIAESHLSSLGLTLDGRAKHCDLDTTALIESLSYWPRTVGFARVQAAWVLKVWPSTIDRWWRGE